MLLTALVACCGSAMADDGLKVQDVNIPQGGEATLEIALENPTTQFAAFQFNVELANSITVVTNDKGKLVYEKGARLDDEFSLSVSQPDPLVNTYRVLGYYTETQAIPSTTGAIVKITIKADAALAIGTSHVCKLSAINLTEPDETKHTPADITFNVKIEENDGRIHFDETSTKLPKFTAGEKGNVVMKRTIHANEWSTIVLPFTLTKAKAEAAFGSDVQLAEFTGFETAYADEEDVTPDGITLNFSTYTMTSKKGITGGKPFLIKTTKDITEFTADEVTLVSQITDVSKSDDYETPGKMTGTFVKSVIPADGLFLNSNKFWYSTGITNVKAFRAWFELGAVLDKETSFEAKVRFTIDDEPTIIEGFTPDMEDGVWYTLDGRQLNGKPTEKGVYIVNGKKVLIK